MLQVCSPSNVRVLIYGLPLTKNLFIYSLGHERVSSFDSQVTDKTLYKNPQTTNESPFVFLNQLTNLRL